MTKLLARTALPHLGEAQAFEARDRFARSEYRQRSHAEVLRDANRLGTDELRFARWLAVLPEHGDDFLQSGEELVLGITPAVRARKSWYMAYKEAGIAAALQFSSTLASR